MTFRNVAGYSASKDKMLDECARKLYLSSYASWKGWWYRSRPPVSQRAGDAYAAKHYQTIYSWAGSIVHAQAEWALKTAMEGRVWEREKLRNVMLERAASTITAGLKQARAKHASNPKYTVRLIELETGGDIDEEYLRDRVRGRILALTSMDDEWEGVPNLFLRAMDSRDRIVVVEGLSSFEHAGLKVWLSTDLVMRSAVDPIHKCVIVDWKTGLRREADDNQVDLYGMWAADRGWIDSETILVYLGDGTTTVKRKLVGDTAGAVNRIESFAKKLSSRLVNNDLHRNEAIESLFEPTTNASTCERCTFQLVCKRGATKP